jgi:PIN domain nuclease of toxin-antitoxin system
MTSMHPSMDCLRRCHDAAVERQVPKQGFRWLPISNAHLLAVRDLESDGVHRDPFDRLLVCQSRVEPMLLLSGDSQLQRYGSTVIVVSL